MRILANVSTVLVIIILLTAGCTNRSTSENKTNKKTETTTVNKVRPQYIALDDTMRNNLVVKGKEVSQKTAQALQKHLKKAIHEKGPAYAVRFCHSKATHIADSVSKAESVTVRRVAVKYRKPENKTTEKENRLFTAYSEELKTGKQPSPVIVTNEEGHPVYYAPIVVGTVCLNCHGKPGKNITSEVMQTIREFYPNDKAVDFEKGQLRGMWAISFDNYIVK